MQQRKDCPSEQQRAGTGRNISVALAFLLFSFAASCSGEGEQQSPASESAPTSTTSSTAAPPSSPAIAAPAPEASDFTLALSDLPEGYGWADREPLLGPTPQTVAEVVRVISGDAAASCIERDLTAPSAPRSQSAAGFAQQYESFVSTQAFQVAATYETDELAKSLIASDGASNIASCIGEAASRGEAHAPADPESILSADAVVTAMPNVFLPGTYGDESQISTITIEAPSTYSTFAVAVIRVGPKVSTVAIVDPVVDQEHDFLSLVAQKMGGATPPKPDMGME
jgi:hypothetical protein